MVVSKENLSFSRNKPLEGGRFKLKTYLYMSCISIYTRSREKTRMTHRNDKFCNIVCLHLLDHALAEDESIGVAPSRAHFKFGIPDSILLGVHVIRQKNVRCTIEDFVETRLRKLRVTLGSRVRRCIYGTMKGIQS